MALNGYAVPIGLAFLLLGLAHFIRYRAHRNDLAVRGRDARTWGVYKTDKLAFVRTGVPPLVANALGNELDQAARGQRRPCG